MKTVWGKTSCVVVFNVNQDLNSTVSTRSGWWYFSISLKLALVFCYGFLKDEYTTCRRLF